MARMGSALAAILLAGLQASADVPASLELNLGTSQTYTFELTSSAEETMKLSIDRKELDAVAGGKKVLVTVTPAEVVTKPGQPATVEFKVEVPTDAPSFAGAKIELNGKGSAGRVNIGSTAVSVKPVVEIKLSGGTPEAWTMGKTANFVAHKDGLKVRFINLDKTKTHTIHSSGAIPHQDGSLPPANEQGPTGMYETVIKPATTPSKAGVYCHEHEGFSALRTLNFNVQAN
ncbi:MAG TPA: hypothetical protein VFV50_17285 [Bdellovibrionales bacterium]|nr:hypothetical protein [Bdellovibrionales bacterium]